MASKDPDDYGPDGRKDADSRGMENIAMALAGAGAGVVLLSTIFFDAFSVWPVIMVLCWGIAFALELRKRKREQPQPTE